eukprot:gene17670-24583_t
MLIDYKFKLAVLLYIFANFKSENIQSIKCLSKPGNANLGTSNIKYCNDNIHSIFASTTNAQPSSTINKVSKINLFPSTTLRKLSFANFYNLLLSNWFIISEILVILFAYWKPFVGKTGGMLRPELTISKIGVAWIFFINGLSLSSEQLRNAMLGFRVNLLTQLHSMVIIPLFTSIFIAPFITSSSIKEGVLSLAVLPCTINACVAITQSANGDVPTAIVNAILGNVVGVLWAPCLLFLLTSSTS